MKGNSSTHIYTDKGRENHEKVVWGQYCPKCGKVICECGGGE